MALRLKDLLDKGNFHINISIDSLQKEVYEQIRVNANFDRVIQRLAESEELQPNEAICYLGRGSFGILVDQKGKKPRYFVRKRIQFEDEHEKYTWRRELSPGISRDYVPSPQRLSELYDEAEAVVVDNGYGKAHQSIYLPKND